MRRLSLSLGLASVMATALTALPTEASAQRQYYDDDGYYIGPTWRDSSGRYRCRRSNGTTGLVIGAAPAPGSSAANPPAGTNLAASANTETDRNGPKLRRRCR